MNVFNCKLFLFFASIAFVLGQEEQPDSLDAALVEDGENGEAEGGDESGGSNESDKDCETYRQNAEDAKQEVIADGTMLPCYAEIIKPIEEEMMASDNKREFLKTKFKGMSPKEKQAYKECVKEINKTQEEKIGKVPPKCKGRRGKRQGGKRSRGGE